MVKFAMRHTLPLSTHGMGHRKPIRLGVIASIIWSSCVGLYRYPNVGNQGEWCDLAATTPKTRILLNVMRGDRPLLLSLTQCYRWPGAAGLRSEEHTSELQSRFDLVCRLLLEKKKLESSLYVFT